MVKKYITVSLDDEMTASLADALSNKTCKKILDYLIDNEACETEIARDLKVPANTVNYNVRKLLKAGLIEKSKSFLWSVKGKKILKYKVANKRIVISPKSSRTVKSVFGAFVAVAAGAVLIRMFSGGQADVVQKGAEVFDEAAIAGASRVVSAAAQPIWIWFLLGGIAALIIFMILNWRRLK